MTLQKPIDTLTMADLISVVANATTEGRALDYKEALPGGKDDDKRELLADVTSFANTAGGHIVWGVAEKRDASGRPTGVPDRVVGVEVTNIEQEITRLDSIVRDGVQPRIPVVRWRPLPDDRGGKPGLFCWIQKSWQAPHMVAAQGLSRFYARGANGKYQLDVQQLRQAFLASEGLREGIRRFRQERLARIVSDEAAMPLWGAAKVVLHVVPLAAFDPSGPPSRFDLSTVRLLPLFGGSSGQRYNLDGVLSYDVEPKNNLCLRYTQVFRNGAIEGVDTVMLRRGSADQRDANWIPSLSFDQGIVRATRDYLAAVERWGLGGPVLVMLSLVDVRGYFMGVASGGAYYRAAEIDRDVVVVPETWIEALPAALSEGDIAKMIRGSLDVVWQAAGIAESGNYNEKGEWAPGR